MTKKAMIFAAGLGTRLKPLTDNKPKALVECNGRTLLEYAILKLRHAGFDELVVNVHHYADLIKDFLRTHDFGLPIHISDESDELLDTGGGLLKAKDLLAGDEPFLVCNVDILTEIDYSALMDFHKRHDALVTLAVSDRKTSRYFLFDDNKQLCAWENRATGDRIVVNERDAYKPLAFSGIHVISPRFFDFVTERGKFSILDLYFRLAVSHPIVAYDHTGDFWLDIGKFGEFTDIEKKVRSRNFDFLA